MSIFKFHVERQYEMMAILVAIGVVLHDEACRMKGLLS